MDEASDEPAPTPPEVLDLQWVMADKRGRRVMHRQLEAAGVYRLSHTGEALSSAFNEGQRNRGLALLAELNAHCPDEYLLMLKEQRE